MAARFELRVPGEDPRVLTLDGGVEIGRTECALTIDDSAVSRRHALLDITAQAVVITDLGSANGTLVNGARIASATALRPGDVVRIGRAELVVLVAELDRQAAVARSQSRTIGDPNLRVHFTPGSVGADVAPRVLTAAKAAARSLERVRGPEPPRVEIFLVDPFVDPSDSDRVIASGSVVDIESGRVWMVATAESKPEDPHRPLALLYASSLPAADEVAHLLEGWALHLAGAADPDLTLFTQGLPAFAGAEDLHRAAMAVSFVRFLLERQSEDTLVELMQAASGAVERRANELYGRSLAGLERAWRARVMTGLDRVPTGEFLRLAVRHLRPHAFKQAELFVYMLLSLAFNAAFPFVTQRIFDDALPSGEFSEVFVLLVALGAAFVVSLLAGLRSSYVSADISGAIVKDIRNDMFGRLQSAPMQWYSTRNQGDVLSRLLSDVQRVEAGLSGTINGGVSQVLTLIVSSVIMLQLDWRLGLLVLAGAPLVVVVYRKMSNGAQKRSVVVQEQHSSLISVAGENYAAQDVVKIFGLGAVERRRFGLATDRLFAAQKRMVRYSGLFGLSVNMIITLLRLLVLGIGAWLILEGKFTVGSLVAFLGVMGDVLSPAAGLTSLGQEVQQSAGALLRVNEVLDAPSETESDAGIEAMAPLASEITLRGIEFSYGPERRVLDGIDVTIPAGARVAFVGPSGSGKSTILRLLMRLAEPDAGAVLVDGIDVRNRSLESWRNQLGVVTQEPFLFDTTLRENILLGAQGATEDDMRAAAAAAEVEAFIDRLPRGFDTIVGERGSNLSGGQRQRVSIARALIRRPRVLLLDEATSALDPRTERQITETLQRIATDRTVIAITHRLTSVVDYDVIYVIDAGRVVESGTHDELLGREGLYRRLWAEQTGVAAIDPDLDADGALRRIALFRDLSAEALSAVRARLEAQRVESGSTVAEDGRLMIIATGRAEVMVLAAGGVHAANELSRGDAFGVAAVLGSPAGAQLHALTDLTLLVLDESSLRELAATVPALGTALRKPGDTAPPAGARQLANATGIMRRPSMLLPGAGATVSARRLTRIEQPRVEAT